MLPRRQGEDLIQLLERQGLGLGEAEVRKDPAEDVPGRVPAEGALGFEGLHQRGPGEGNDEVEAPGCGGGEGHADVADVEGLFR